MSEPPRLVFASSGRRLGINCYVEEDSPKVRRVYTRAKKYRLLEEVLDCRVEVEVCAARDVRMVA